MRTTKRGIAWLVCLVMLLSMLPAVSLAADPEAARDGEEAAIPIYEDTSYSFAERAADLVARMSLSQKGSQMISSPAPAIPAASLGGGALNVPATKDLAQYYWWNESLHGYNRIDNGASVRGGGAGPANATSYPQSLTVGSTWNPELYYQEALQVSDEIRERTSRNALGNAIDLNFYSPTVNLQRDPRWGRNEESYSEDPYLTVRMGSQYVLGLEGKDQEGNLLDPDGYYRLHSTIKHYVANNSESNRLNGGAVTSLDALRNYYLAPYRGIIKATDVTSVMTAYSSLNGEPCSYSSYLMDTILRQTYGLSGYVTSDCDAVGTMSRLNYVNPRTGAVLTNEERLAGALAHGEDLECNGGYTGTGNYNTYSKNMVNGNVQTDKGLFTENTMDISLHRLLTGRIATGEFDDNLALTQAALDRIAAQQAADPSSGVYNQTPERIAIMEQVNNEGVVMLQNKDNFLPLQIPASGEYKVVIVGAWQTNMYLGLYSAGANNTAKQITIQQGIENAIRAKNPDATFTCITADSVTEANQADIEAADVCVVVGGANNQYSAEDRDRNSIAMNNNQAAMFSQVGQWNPNTVAVMEYCGPVETYTFANDVKAILWSSFEGLRKVGFGNVITGAVNPSGKLTATWYHSTADLPDKLNYDLYPSEGVDGRTYMFYKGDAVEYPFGYGLSFTTYAYSNLRIDKTAYDANDTVKVSFDVKNTGTVAGKEIAQLYIAQPDATAANRPIRRLEGFDKIELQPGEIKTVNLEVKIPDLAYYSEADDCCSVDTGAYQVQVGGSSASANLTADFTVSGAMDVYPELLTVKANAVGDTEKGIEERLIYDKGSVINPQLTVCMNNEKLYGYIIADQLSPIKQMQSTPLPEGMTFSYSSNRPSVVSVEGDEIKAVGPGVATVTVTGTLDGKTVTADFVAYVEANPMADVITADGETLAGFERDQFNYELMIERGADIPVIAATGPDDVEITVNQAAEVPGIATVVATDKASGVPLTYRIGIGYAPVSTDFSEGWDAADEKGWKVLDGNENAAFGDAGLTITPEEGSFTNAHPNNLYLESAVGDWVAQTHLTLSAAASQAGQQAGLVVYDDDRSSFRIVVDYNPGFTWGQWTWGNSPVLRVYSVDEGSQTQVASVDLSTADVHLQIIKSGSSYEASYSTDGEHWTVLGSGIAVMALPHLGVTAAGADYTATFDGINIVKLSDLKPRLASLSVDGVPYDAFDPNIYNYNEEISPEETKVPVVSAAAADPTHEVTVEQLSGPAGSARVLVTSPAATAVYTVSFNYAPVDSYFADGTLGSEWTIERELAEEYQLAKGEGLKLYTQVEDFYQTGENWHNTFTMPAQGNWQAVAKAFFPTTELQTYQQVGMAVWQDEDNYLRINLQESRLFIEPGVEKDGVMSTNVFQTANAAASEDGTVTIYFRINKIGDEYTLSYSQDGADFRSLGSVTANYADPKLVLSAGQNSSNTPVWLNFEYVAVTSKDGVDANADFLGWARQNVADYIAADLPAETGRDLRLSPAPHGYTVTLQSSDPSVIAADGTVTPAAEDKTVTVTVKVSEGDATATAAATVKVLAAGSVEPEADKTELNAAIADAEAVDKELYTAESVAALESALETAKAVQAAEDAGQDAVDAASAALRAAIAGLEIKPVPVPKTHVANPYLPMWEHIPDGEPRVFTDPASGEQRLYIYGSHDSRSDAYGYCGKDHVTWSAPLDDLTDWRFENTLIDTSALVGVTYTDAEGNEQILEENANRVLFAPDVIYYPDNETYYMFLFPNPDNKIFVATSKSPAGPFTNPKYVCDGFDPAALVDDELDENGKHKVYLYYSTESGRDGYACQLDPDNGMSVIPGTLHYPDTFKADADEAVSAKATMLSKNLAPFHFFEGPSIRKVNGWYLLSYQRSAPTNPENTGNGKLAEIGWAYSKNPYGDPDYPVEALRDEWHYGGVIVSNLGENVANPYAEDPENPDYIDTFYGQNTHGGMVQVGGQWYQVYHRATGNGIKRQSLIEPFTMEFDETDGHPIIQQVEMTSQGVQAGGLDPYQTYYAAIACYKIGGQYVTWSWGDWVFYGDYPVFNCTTDGNYDANGEHGDWYPIEQIRNRTWLGYKYFNFGQGTGGGELTLTLSLKEFAPGTVNVYANDPKANYEDTEKPKTLIGTRELLGEDAEEHEIDISLDAAALTGRKGIYLEFLSADGSSETELVKLNKLGFSKTEPVMEYRLAESFEPGKTYVVVADDAYALSASTNAQGSLSATSVTVDADVITSEVTEDMLWTFDQAQGVDAPTDGRELYLISDAEGRNIRRGSGGTAALQLGTFDAGSSRYYTWSLAERTAEDSAYTLYVNSTSSYVYYVTGAETGFSVSYVSNSGWDTQTSGSSIRLYELTGSGPVIKLDKTAIRAAIRAAGAVRRELYTDETLAALDAALAAANTALAEAQTQQALDDAAAALNEAIAALERRPVEPNKPVEIPDDGVQAANPYLPMWERIPDGEPRIFNDPETGEERMYVYGSHDTTGFYCGPDHVVWSAPLTDLTNWRYEGLAIKTTDLDGIPYVDQNGADQILHIQSGHLFYAPDVVYNPTTEKYTMIGFLSEANPRSFIFAATSDTPGGPFTDPHFIGWGFDPAVLVDDELDENGHQRMYLYWSIEADRSGWAAELDPETVTIIDGTTHSPRVNGTVEGLNTMFSKGDEPFYFFEGPSIRKIDDTYVLSYARSKPLEGDSNGYLSEIGYATSDNPFGDPALGSEWEYGGVIIDNKGELVADPYAEGAATYTYFGGNNHGGMIRAGDDWYQIYHRDTNKSSKRQSMAVKLNVYYDDAGKLKIDQAEFTSEGFRTEGLDPYERLYAASFCYALPTTGGSWWSAAGPVISTNDSLNFDPAAERDNWYGVSNLKNHTWVGYKYYNFGDGLASGDSLKLALTLKELGAGTVNIYASDAKESYADPEQPKTLIGTVTLTGENAEAHTVEGQITNTSVLKGKQAIYLEFVTDSTASIAELNELQFVREAGATVDKTALEEAIAAAEAEAATVDVYTDESLAALNEALEAAKAVQEDPDATQDEVDAAAQALNEAIEALEVEDIHAYLEKLAKDAQALAEEAKAAAEAAQAAADAAAQSAAADKEAAEAAQAAAEAAQAKAEAAQKAAEDAKAAAEAADADAAAQAVEAAAQAAEAAKQAAEAAKAQAAAQAAQEKAEEAQAAAEAAQAAAEAAEAAAGADKEAADAAKQAAEAAQKQAEAAQKAADAAKQAADASNAAAAEAAQKAAEEAAKVAKALEDAAELVAKAAEESEAAEKAKEAAEKAREEAEAAALAAEKSNAKTMAAIAALGVDTTDFTPEQMAELEKILDDAADAIDAAEDSEGVQKALEDAVKALEELAGEEPPFRFDDVQDESKFYFEPVYWAYEAEPQITNGKTANLYGPDDGCTRGQVVTFLWRAAGCPEPKSADTPFTDLKEGAFYLKAVAWAVENEITNGTSETTFSPDDTCTRGQIVTFLWRFKGTPEPKSTETKFTDVPATAFYAKAVAWAVENDVTKGMTDTTFVPNNTCTRGQVVTFLYRAMEGE